MWVLGWVLDWGQVKVREKVRAMGLVWVRAMGQEWVRAMDLAMGQE